MSAARFAASLALVGWTAAAALSAKAAWDVLARAGSFPWWFAPAFAAGVAALAAVAGWFTIGVWRARGAARLAAGPLATAVWILLPLSFLCTSAVHQLHPFRPAPLSAYLELGPVLRFNLALTLAGFIAAVGLALLWRAGRRGAAAAGLMILALALLVPNDDCANPFNEWWIATLGASPLMFVPNLYAALFGLAALAGPRPRLAATALAGTCAAVLVLGLGHMTRVIW